jgi:hypothetical protein
MEVDEYAVDILRFFYIWWYIVVIRSWQINFKIKFKSKILQELRGFDTAELLSSSSNRTRY